MEVGRTQQDNTLIASPSGPSEALREGARGIRSFGSLSGRANDLPGASFFSLQTRRIS